MRIRENAEAIAMYHGEGQEQRHIQRVFARLYANYDHLIRWTLRLNFFYYGNSLLSMVMPTLIIAPRVLSGELEVGSIVQATGAFTSILGSLTLLVDNLDGLSRFAAGVGRLESLAAGMAPEAATPEQASVDHETHVGDRQYAQQRRPRRSVGLEWEDPVVILPESELARRTEHQIGRAHV